MNKEYIEKDKTIKVLGSTSILNASVYIEKDKTIKVLGVMLFLGAIGLCSIVVYIAKIAPLSDGNNYYEYLYSIYSCFSPTEYKFISSSTPHVSTFRSSYETLYVLVIGGGLLLLSLLKLKYRYLFFYLISLLGCFITFVVGFGDSRVILNRLIVLGYFITVGIVGFYIYKMDQNRA